MKASFGVPPLAARDHLSHFGFDPIQSPHRRVATAPVPRIVQTHRMHSVGAHESKLWRPSTWSRRICHISALTRSSPHTVASRALHCLASSRHTACNLSERTKASFGVLLLGRAAFVTFSALTRSSPHTVASRAHHCLASSRHTVCTLLHRTKASFEVPPLGRAAFVTFSTLTRSSPYNVVSRLRHCLASSRHTACTLSERMKASFAVPPLGRAAFVTFSTLTRSSPHIVAS
jgi:hypothetical protein